MIENNFGKFHGSGSCVNGDKARWNWILKAFANSLDPDETPQNVASHQDPNCTHLYHLGGEEQLWDKFLAQGNSSGQGRIRTRDLSIPKPASSIRPLLPRSF
ncbi:hypothetical protein DPMN_047480 [Dreissena polymorpha]|uniref:Uncharacterized protein n=1 Tax=Dreissena polymorpha TaxID=45954 RepID=A0A9D4I1G2_DREPO|nr:hypothetical protein DPMN_047480 [Dreissena polymorpha]